MQQTGHEILSPPSNAVFEPENDLEARLKPETTTIVEMADRLVSEEQ